MSKEEEEEQSRGFKVADRRRFVDHEDAADAVAADEIADAATGDTASNRDDAAASKAAEPPPAAASPDPGATEASGAPAGVEDADLGGAGGPFPEMTFSTFVISLMTQALMHLGEMAEEGHPPARDLPAAKQMIDLLGILRDKTTGNLDASEEQLLGQMLYDLRMRYVEVSRGS